MNPNHGDYMGVVYDRHDGCQWNPDERRGALPDDRHFRTTKATMIVGGQSEHALRYRLCSACAAHPYWRTSMKRPIDGPKPLRLYKGRESTQFKPKGGRNGDVHSV